MRLIDGIYGRGVAARRSISLIRIRGQTILEPPLHTYLKKIQSEVTGSVPCPDDLNLVDVLIRCQKILELALHPYLKKIQSEVAGSVLFPDDLNLIRSCQEKEIVISIPGAWSLEF